MGQVEVEFRPVPPGCAGKNAGTVLQSWAKVSLCPALRPCPHAFSRSNAGSKQVLAGPKQA
jgi:hypothetical protein